jgi:YbbR domain-containing protein
MQSFKHFITHNWFLKIVSLLLATMLWVAIASETSSEIGLEVPVEYRNIPPQLEITGDTTSTVQVRLRGSSNLVKEISPKDVSTILDLAGMKAGEKIISLTPQNVQVPFGAEVVRVNPSRVRFSLERTISKLVPVVPAIEGQPAAGYELGNVLLSPSKVQVEGPESRVSTLDSVPTVAIRIDGKKSNVIQSADLDVPDPQVRVQHPAAVDIRIEIRAK